VAIGPPILGEADTPDFEHAFSNRTQFRAWPVLVEFHLASSESSWRKKEDRRRITV